MSTRHAKARRRRKPRGEAGIWEGYAPLDAGMGARSVAAFSDVAEGFRRWRSWIYLAVESVKNQYRRTVIGPWWLTIQTSAYVAGLALLFGAIFRQPLREFVPYVAAGFISFTFLAGVVRGGAEIFVKNASAIKSTRQPLSMHVLQAVMVELLLFAHNMIILIAFLIAGLIPMGFSLLLVLPAIAAMIVNGVALGLWLGPTVARYRDVGPFVNSVLQVLVFFTPIFWTVESLEQANRAAFLGWNPFAYLLGVFRDPMLGDPLYTSTYVGAGLITFINVLLAAVVFSRTRSRLPYWVS